MSDELIRARRTSHDSEQALDIAADVDTPGLTIDDADHNHVHANNSEVEPIDTTVVDPNLNNHLGRAIRGQTIRLHYGSTGPLSSPDGILPIFLTPPIGSTARTNSIDRTPSSTSDDGLDTYSIGGERGQRLYSPPPSRGFRMGIFRLQTSILSALLILRQKYLDRALIYIYFAVLFGTSPVGVCLFLQSPTFAHLYLRFSHTAHTVVQMINILIFYLFVSSAFNLQAIFSAVGLNLLVGNIGVAFCSGSMLALEFIDRVAVYLNEAYYDKHGFFVPSPPPSAASSTSAVAAAGDGFTPNSVFLTIMFYLSLFALMSALVNCFHLLFYFLEYRRIMNRNYQQIEDEEGYSFESDL